jgi:carboxylesterase
VREREKLLSMLGGFAMGAAGILGFRWLAGKRLLRASASRLPVGEAGIIRGAEPVRLDAPGARSALLLLHGFGDTPQTLSYLAPALHARGYTVHAPLLPGHGRSVRDFARSSAAQWLESAREALRELTSSHERVGVVGLSMGGAIAARIAAVTPELRALALLAPYCDAPRPIRELARYRLLVATFIPYMDGRNERSIIDPEERARGLGYGVTTPRLLSELVSMADTAREALPHITAPTLILQSRDDNRIAPEVAESVFERLGSAEKALEWVDGGHVITVDHGRETVIERVGEWMDQWVGN